MEHEEIRKRAKRKAEAIVGFVSHLVTYIGVNAVLAVINFATSPEHLWFWWVTLFWGIGLFWHFLGAVVLQGWLGELEERIYRKELRRALGQDFESKEV